jgi:acyl-CoA hydrolase
MPDRPREITFRFLAEPIDMNYRGTVHGGTAMRWIDQTGYACATGWCGQYCVTVYAGGIRFLKPIAINHLVEVHAKLIYTGTSSMHVAVTVSSANPRQQVFERTTRCIVVYVAVDENGRPIPVPKWMPLTPEDVALEKHAVKVMEVAKQLDAEMPKEKQE